VTEQISATESRIARWWLKVGDLFRRDPAVSGKRWRVKLSLIVLAIILVPMLFVSWYWSREPKPLWVNESPAPGARVAGFSTVDTLIRVTSTLLDKPGGYLRNDLMPPGWLLDNIPAWEYGAVVQVRDLAKVLRNDYSRSQSQSVEDDDLSQAEPLLNFDASSWILPSTEGEYKKAIGHLVLFRARLIDQRSHDAQFYARADNLREWLGIVEKRLGSLTQRLTASVGQTRVNVDLAGERAAEQSTPGQPDVTVKTPWLELDDVFFESRGAAWALIAFMRAAEFDFQDVLRDKNATVSLRQIIRELEASQQPLRSPMVLNGRGFGLFPNHSLVMATYLARANAAVINLRELLSQG
jgi:hypothetical protein